MTAPITALNKNQGFFPWDLHVTYLGMLHYVHNIGRRKRDNIFKETSFVAFVPSVFPREQLGSALWHHYATYIWLNYQQNAT